MATQNQLDHAAGKRWERTFVNMLARETGLNLSRQLTETREGNLGDMEVHPRLPFVPQMRTSRQDSPPNPWRALRDAEAAAQALDLSFGVGALEHRRGRGRANLRAVVLDLEWWLELVEQSSITRRPLRVYHVIKKGKTYPRIWDGLEEAMAEVGEAAGKTISVNSIPVCFGYREEGNDAALLPADDFCKIAGRLVREDVW